jgi:multiple sugar transport system ATP-binding protein
MTLGERIAVLKGGRLQQVADPFTLYQRPANQFVAGFIGSPPMNFFSAGVAASGEVALQVDGVSILLPPELARRVQGQRGGAVTVGIRPEDLLLAPQGPGGRLDGQVELREPLGNEVLVHWRTLAGAVVSRVPGDAAPAVGVRASLHFAFARVHLFDPGTERALVVAEA